MTALDTNVIVDLGEGAPEVVETTLLALERAADAGGLVICGIVYAELCSRRSGKELDSLLREAQVTVETALPLQVWREAGAAYGAYAARRKPSGGGLPRRIMADFVIGAHARAVGSLVTSDAAFFRRAFPGLAVVEAS